MCAVVYRSLRPSPPKAAKARNEPIDVIQKKRQGEDLNARIAAVFGLIAIPVVGAIVVSYGTGIAMSAGSSPSNRAEVWIRAIVYIPEILGCYACARAQTKVTAILALPCVAIYFLPNLQRNLGL